MGIYYENVQGRPISFRIAGDRPTDEERAQINGILSEQFGVEPRPVQQVEEEEPEGDFLGNLASGIGQGFFRPFVELPQGIAQQASSGLRSLGIDVLPERIEDTWLGRRTEDVAGAVDWAFGEPDPDSTAGFIGEVGGNVLGLLVPGLGLARAARGVGASATGANIFAGLGMAGIGASMGTNEQLDRIRQYEETAGEPISQEAFDASVLLGGAIGTTEALPVGRLIGILRRVPASEANRVARTFMERIRSAAIQGSAEAFQEASAGILQDLVEQGIYNDDLEIGQDLLTNLAAGGGAGAVVDFLLQTMAGRRLNRIDRANNQLNDDLAAQAAEAEQWQANINTAQTERQEDIDRRAQVNEDLIARDAAVQNEVDRRRPLGLPAPSRNVEPQAREEPSRPAPSEVTFSLANLPEQVREEVRYRRGLEGNENLDAETSVEEMVRLQVSPDRVYQTIAQMGTTPIVTEVERQQFEPNLINEAVKAITDQDTVTTQDIATSLGLNKNQTEDIMRALERRGLVAKRPNYDEWQVRRAARSQQEYDAQTVAWTEHEVAELPVEQGNRPWTFEGANPEERWDRRDDALKAAKARAAANDSKPPRVFKADGRPSSAWAIVEKKVTNDGRVVAQTPLATFTTREGAERAKARLGTQKVAEDGTPQADPIRPKFRRVQAYGKPTQDFLAKRDNIERELNKVLNERQLKNVAAKVVPFIKAPTGNVAEGVFDVDADGKMVIAAALDIYDPNLSESELLARMASVIDHEMIHAARAKGMFTDQQWNTLKRYVTNKKVPGKEYTYLDRATRIYAQQAQVEGNPDLIYEEAIAEAFRDYAKNPQQVEPGPRGIFRRMVRFFRAMGKALRRNNVTRAEQIFEQVRTGTLPENTRPTSTKQSDTKSFTRFKVTNLSPEQRVNLLKRAPAMQMFGSQDWQDVKLGEATNPNSRTTVMLLTPDEFIHLSTSGLRNVGAEKIYAQNVFRGMVYHDIPYLGGTLSEDGTTIIMGAHEGRHRAHAAKELGYKYIPVMVKVLEHPERGTVRWGRAESFPTKLKSQNEGYELIDSPGSLTFENGKSADRLQDMVDDKPLNELQFAVGVAPSEENVANTAEFIQRNLEESQHLREDAPTNVNWYASEAVRRIMTPVAEVAELNGGQVVNAGALGVYAGWDPEVSSSLEFRMPANATSNQINDVAAEVFNIAKLNDQYDAYVAEDVGINYKGPDARPGITVFFSPKSYIGLPGYKKTDLDEVLETIDISLLGGMTAFQDDKVSRGDDRFQGVRFIWMPEYAGVKPEDLETNVQKVLEDFERISKVVSDNNLGSVQVSNYRAMLGRKGEYDDLIRKLRSQDDGRKGKEGQRQPRLWGIRESVERRLEPPGEGRAATEGYGGAGQQSFSLKTLIFNGPHQTQIYKKQVAAPEFRKFTPDPDFWQDTYGDINFADEPPLPTGTTKGISTGVVMYEPDGRIWIVEPANHFGGYNHTFPKGRMEEGLSPHANAAKEVWEESGLIPEIEGFLGDFEGDTSITRYYYGRRLDGDPADFGQDETWATKLVPFSKLKSPEYLNKERDRQVADALREKLPIDMPQYLVEPAPEIALRNFLDFPQITPKTNEGSWTKRFVRDGDDEYMIKFPPPKYPDEIPRGMTSQSMAMANVLNEKFANELYKVVHEDIESGVPEVFVHADPANGYGLAVRWIDGLEPTGFSFLADWVDKNREIAAEQFVIDSLLSSYDVVGMFGDNMLWEPKWGRLIRVDVGGALMYRAQGLPKGERFSTDPEGDINGMRNPEYPAGKMYYSLTDQEVGDAWRRLNDPDGSVIGKLIDRARIVNYEALPEVKGMYQHILDTLKERVANYGKWVEAYAPDTSPKATDAALVDVNQLSPVYISAPQKTMLESEFNKWWNGAGNPMGLQGPSKITKGFMLADNTSRQPFKGGKVWEPLHQGDPNEPAIMYRSAAFASAAPEYSRHTTEPTIYATSNPFLQGNYGSFVTDQLGNKVAQAFENVTKGADPEIVLYDLLAAQYMPDWMGDRAEKMLRSREFNPATIIEWLARNIGWVHFPIYVQASNPFDYRNEEHRDRLNRHLKERAVGDMQDRDYWKTEIRKGEYLALEDNKIIRAMKELKHDGFLTKEGDALNVGVFSRTQFKSIFNPFHPGAATSPRLSMYSLNAPAGNRVPPTAQSTIKNSEINVRYGAFVDMWKKIFPKSKRWNDGVERSVIDWQDKMYSVGKMLDDARDTGYVLYEPNDTYMKEQLASGRIGTRIEDNKKNFYDPMMQRVKALNISQDFTQQFRAMDPKVGMILDSHSESPSKGMAELYLYARHAPERNAEIARRNPKDPQMQDGGSGMTTALATQIMNKINASAKAGAFRDFGAAFDQIIKDTNNTRVEGGLTIDFTTQQTYQNYAPLRGWIEEDPLADEIDDTIRARSGRGFKIRGLEDKHAMGRRRMATDIMAHAMLQNEEAIIRAEKNNVGNAFLSMVESDPALFERMGVARLVRQTPMRRVLDNGIVKLKPDPFWKNRDDILVVKRNGVEYGIEIMNPRIAEAMTKAADIGEGSASVILRSIGKFTRMMAMLNTALNPEFLLSNFPRDLQTAGINAAQFDIQGLSKDVFKGALPAAKAIHKAIRTNDYASPWGQAYKEFREAGGTAEWYGLRSVHDRIADLNKALNEDFSKNPLIKSKRAVKAVGDFIENYNRAFENAARVSLFRALRDRGISRERAAMAAKNITVNFNQGGRNKGVMNALYMFYNASIQGTFAMMNGFARSKRVRRIFGGLFLAGVMQDALMSALSPEDEDGELVYDKIPDWILEHRMVFPDIFGMSERGYFSIPMPYGFNAIFNMGRATTRLARGSYSVGDWLGSGVMGTVDAFNPVAGTENLINFLAPTFADPLVDLYATNENFMGREIYPENSGFGPDRPAHTLYWNGTWTPYVSVAEWLSRLSGGTSMVPGDIEISPNQIEHALEFVLGGTGSFVRRLMTLGEEGIVTGFDTDLMDIETFDIPVIRQLYGGVSSRQDIGSYIERRDHILSVNREIEDAAELGQPERIDAAFERWPREIQLIELFREVDSERSQLLTTIREIERAPGLTETQKREIIDDIREQEQMLILIANRAYNEAFQ